MCYKKLDFLDEKVNKNIQLFFITKKSNFSKKKSRNP